MCAQHWLVLILVLGAADQDLKSFRIDNLWLLVCWILLFLERVAAGPPGGILSMMTSFLFGTLLPVLILFPFFIFRMIGAGDIKLLAVLGSTLGPSAALSCLFWTFLIAALFSMGQILLWGSGLQRFRYFFTYFCRFLKTKGACRPAYGIREASAARVYVSIPVLCSALLWIGGVYH